VSRSKPVLALTGQDLRADRFGQVVLAKTGASVRTLSKGR